MIAPCGWDGFAENAFVGLGKEYVGAAFAAPGAVARIENRGMGLDEIFLLDGSELDHGELFVWIGKGGENFSGYSEVGMVHVLVFFRLREAEGDTAEVGWSG